MKKSQISMEYMIIVGFVIVITIPMILIFSSQSTSIDESLISNQAALIASKIVDSAETVYYLGNSSKVTFKVNMPKMIHGVNISNNEVVFRIKQHNGISDIVKYSIVPINGTISKKAGIFNIVVESRGDYVWVSN